MFGRGKKDEAGSSGDEKIFLQDDGILAVCAAAGLPAELITNSTVLGFVLPACLAVFGEGVLQVRYDKAPEPGLRKWFGQRDITEGRFFERLSELYQRPPAGPPHPLDDLQRAVAAIFARGAVFGDGASPFAFTDVREMAPPAARVDGEDVVFGGHYGQGEYREHLTGPVNYLLAIEPGISLVHVIDQQVSQLAVSGRSYCYICVPEGPLPASSSPTTHCCAAASSRAVTP